MRAALSLLLVLLLAWPARAQDGPIIDMHAHVGPGSAESSYYTLEPGEAPDDARMRTLLADLDAHHVVMALLSGPRAYTTRIAAADTARFVAGMVFPCTDGRDANLYPCFADGADWPDLDTLRVDVEAGRVGMLGELYNVYAGVSPLDPRMWPYYDFAAEHDLIVAVHADTGPPAHARTPGCCAHFDGMLGDPGFFRTILQRHPDLRLYLMHVTSRAFVPVAIALMDQYPNVVVDVSPMSMLPAAAVHRALRQFIDAGHGDRIVFGSDFLGAVGPSLEVLRGAGLSDEQMRAILYDNAARFLRLDAGTIDRHHGR